MKRLIRRSYEDKGEDVRNFVIKTTPLYPSHPGQFNDEFQESDDKSFSKMINDLSLKNKTHLNN